MLNTKIIEKSNIYQENIEREILRIILAGGRKYQQAVLPLIDSEMFTNAHYRVYAQTAKELFAVKSEIDGLIIFKNCEIKGMRPSQVLAELNEIEFESVCRANYMYYVNKLIQAHLNRLSASATTYEDVREIEKTKRKYFVEENTSSIYAGVEKILFDYYDSLETCIHTGYQGIDNSIGSLMGGDFIILAGATGMGKTCMALNLIERMSKVLGKKVLLFSLEMKKPQLQNRMICSALGIDALKFRKHDLTKTEIEKYADYANADFRRLNVEVCDDTNVTIDKVKSTIQKSDADIVVIDYLGLIKGDERKEGYERFGAISRELKVLAMDENIPIIALHQLNRASADRKDKRPKLSDLRDSGKIEQDADMIWFVFRPKYYDYTKPEDLMQFIIGKNRHGKGGVTVDLCYNPSTQTISDRLTSF